MALLLKYICNFLSNLLVLMLVSLGVLFWGFRLFGMEAFAVQSGSMEPVHPTGSLIYVKQTDVSTLEVGDVITFRLHGNVTGTHRIIEIISDTEQSDSIRFRTKGDANDAADCNPVESKDVIGKVIFSIPYLGFISHFIQLPIGKYIVVFIGCLSALLSIIPKVLFDDKKNMKIQEEL